MSQYPNLESIYQNTLNQIKELIAKPNIIEEDGTISLYTLLENIKKRIEPLYETFNNPEIINQFWTSCQKILPQNKDLYQSKFEIIAIFENFANTIEIKYEQMPILSLYKSPDNNSFLWRQPFFNIELKKINNYRIFINDNKENINTLFQKMESCQNYMLNFKSNDLSKQKYEQINFKIDNIGITITIHNSGKKINYMFYIDDLNYRMLNSEWSDGRPSINDILNIYKDEIFKKIEINPNSLKGIFQTIYNEICPKPASKKRILIPKRK